MWRYVSSLIRPGAPSYCFRVCTLLRVADELQERPLLEERNPLQGVLQVLHRQFQAAVPRAGGDTRGGRRRPHAADGVREHLRVPPTPPKGDTHQEAVLAADVVAVLCLCRVSTIPSSNSYNNNAAAPTQRLGKGERC
eukprot:1183090-Prorocentrum_minimum.AAC.1